MSQSPKSLFSTSRKDELASVGLDKEIVKSIIKQEWTAMSSFAKEKWVVMSNQLKETAKGEDVRGEGESESVLDEVLKRLIALEAKNTAQAKLIKKLEAKVEKARRAELFDFNNRDVWQHMCTDGHDHNFKKIEDYLAQGMSIINLDPFLYGVISASGHPSYRNSTEEGACSFFVKINELYGVKFVHNNPKEQGYVYIALRTNNVKIAKCLYELGAEFDPSRWPGTTQTVEEYLTSTGCSHGGAIKSAVYAFIASVSK
jgi:hypothetical protein